MTKVRRWGKDGMMEVFPLRTRHYVFVDLLQTLWKGLGECFRCPHFQVCSWTYPMIQVWMWRQIGHTHVKNTEEVNVLWHLDLRGFISAFFFLLFLLFAFFLSSQSTSCPLLLLHSMMWIIICDYSCREKSPSPKASAAALWGRLRCPAVEPDPWGADRQEARPCSRLTVGFCC